MEKYTKKVKELRNYYLEQVSKKIPFSKLNGGIENRLAGNANVSFEGVDGEAILYELDKRGICASSGSACMTGSSMPSYVLLNIGVSPELTSSSIRTTFGEDNTMEDVDFLVQSLVDIIEEIK